MTDARAGALLNWYRLLGLEPPEDVVAAAEAQREAHRRAGCRCRWCQAQQVTPAP